MTELRSSNAGVIRRTNTAEGRESAIAMLRRLREGDVQEQTETLEYLKVALDKDRPSYRKLFSEQKLVTYNLQQHNEAV